VNRRLTEKLSFQTHLKKVKDRYKGSSISHDKARQIVTCDYGIEQLKLTCEQVFLDFDQLINPYRAIEKLVYNLEFSPSPKIKCGLVINFKYNLTHRKASLLARTSENTLGRIYQKVRLHVKVVEKLEYDPDFSPNNKLYYLLCYLKDISGIRFSIRTLKGVFFEFLATCPLEIGLDRFTQIISDLIKNIIQLKRVGELELAKKDENFLKKVFESSSHDAFDSYYSLLLVE